MGSKKQTWGLSDLEPKLTANQIWAFLQLESKLSFMLNILAYFYLIVFMIHFLPLGHVIASVKLGMGLDQVPQHSFQITWAIPC